MHIDMHFHILGSLLGKLLLSAVCVTSRRLLTMVRCPTPDSRLVLSNPIMLCVLVPLMFMMHMFEVDNGTDLCWCQALFYLASIERFIVYPPVCRCGPT